MAKNRLGEVRKNNKGTDMKIITYRKADDIDVQFLDEYGYIKEHTMYQLFKIGQIKNPYDKTIYNIGCIGVGNHKIWDNDIKRNSPVYDIWSAMIERCYINKKKYPAYYGIVTICDEWLVFQNFAEWYDENKYECEGRLHVDKDILHPGNKVYSPENCILLPQRINELFSVPQNVMLAHFDESAANAEVANVSEVILIANASNNDKIFFIIFTYFIQFLKR